MKGFLFVMTLLLTGPAAASDWPDVPVPDGVKREWVADQMVFNGVAMRIFTFNYPHDLETLKHFYADAWDARGRDHKQASQGKWWVLSSLQGDYYTTVQITDLGGTTYAQVGVSRIADLRTSAPPGEGVPALPRSEVINDITAEDAGRPSRTVILRNQHSVGSNYNYYLNHYRSHHWTAVHKNLDQSRRGARISLVKEDREMDIVIKRQGRDVNIMTVEVHR
ncbi:hypothetical protein A11A3_11693 [Alcanivorax hongdengensis A-11-3]|uniref:Uncharacterized protein n=1 Tax=Alcanivorax hongdengensis A-11-3 TaxID=1177179 RepID=L0WDK9_9GAMM|nr:hypothetical protein [Alcanivorax hongdengensis]EKF73870.1 hypothetical protein A11A3_11693 [Alcanivorax hongdengensis A-11-3]